MGCDGGTIPKRDELVRTKKKPEQKDKQSELSFRWGHCSITQEPLQKPIVGCQLGRLYSKVSILEALLDKTKLPEGANHVKSMRDVKELNLTENNAFQSKAKTSETYDGSLIAPYICPVSGLEMNGKFRFVFFWSCGCVLSERALKAIDAKHCHKCQTAFTNEDVIVLNGNEDDLNKSKELMLARKEKIKALKKEKKKEVKSEPSTGPSCSTSSAANSNAAGKRAATLDLADPLFKKAKAEYSVAKDPKASAVYKSLFTSHESAEKKGKAHWVTYNPFYN